MKTRLNVVWIRTVVGIMIYLTMLGLATVASYALLAGPQRFGIDDSWPLVFYFVVPYLGTLLVGIGIVGVIRHGPELMRRAL